jgi:hypothetical protein
VVQSGVKITIAEKEEKVLSLLMELVQHAKCNRKLEYRETRKEIRKLYHTDPDVRGIIKIAVSSFKNIEGLV